MSNQPQVTLAPLEPDDKGQFILDNQEAFKYGATIEFGMRDNHFEEDDEIISRDTIEQSIEGGEAYRILLGKKKVGGVVLRVDGDHGDLELLFVSPKEGRRLDVQVRESLKGQVIKVSGGHAL